jgi:hypothetical protein
MPLKHQLRIANPHAQDGLLVNVLMDDPVYLMDDASAIMGGPTTFDRLPRTRIVLKGRSKIR